MEYNTMLLLLAPALTGLVIGCAGWLTFNNKGVLWLGIVISSGSITLIIGGAAVNALRNYMGWIV